MQMWTDCNIRITLAESSNPVRLRRVREIVTSDISGSGISEIGMSEMGL